MNWKDFWNHKAGALESNQQVARIIKGEPMQEDLLWQIAEKISKQLHLHKSDTLLDVCCGNGALSMLLLPKCKQIQGVDFSEKLIESANKLSNHSIQFTLGAAADFNLNQSFDKILLYFSFQYFESYAEGKAVIENLVKHAKPGALILIGDITDQRKFFQYYHSVKKVIQFSIHKLLGKNNMGKFWHPNALVQICHELHIKGTVLEQEPWQPYSKYRFDFLIEVV